MRTYKKYDSYSKKHEFDTEGRIVLLNAKELPRLGLKNKQRVVFETRNAFSSTKKIKGEVIILKVTSKDFKKLYTLEYGDWGIKLKEKYKYDVLLFKALQYAK